MKTNSPAPSRRRFSLKFYQLPVAAAPALAAGEWPARQLPGSPGHRPYQDTWSSHHYFLRAQ